MSAGEASRWHGFSNIEPISYTCGYCGNLVGSKSGYFASQTSLRIYICSFCARPTFVDRDVQVPGHRPGAEVDHLPPEVAALYREARDCIAASAFTASVLASRKLLMNIAVSKGAKEGLSFVAYIDFLADEGFVPPGGRGWVDHIRATGNEATHEIALMPRQRAEELVRFSEMLLRFIFEFPALIPPAI